jgi:hypothetical protein
MSTLESFFTEDEKPVWGSLVELKFDVVLYFQLQRIHMNTRTSPLCQTPSLTRCAYWYNLL